MNTVNNFFHSFFTFSFSLSLFSSPFVSFFLSSPVLVWHLVLWSSILLLSFSNGGWVLPFICINKKTLIRESILKLIITTVSASIDSFPSHPLLDHVSPFFSILYSSSISFFSISVLLVSLLVIQSQTHPKIWLIQLSFLLLTSSSHSLKKGWWQEWKRVSFCLQTLFTLSSFGIISSFFLLIFLPLNRKLVELSAKWLSHQSYR